jgi:hypothetical protein
VTSAETNSTMHGGGPKRSGGFHGQADIGTRLHGV